MVCVSTGGLDRSKASTEWARKSMGSMGWKALTISFGRGVEVDLWAGLDSPTGEWFVLGLEGWTGVLYCEIVGFPAHGKHGLESPYNFLW